MPEKEKKNFIELIKENLIVIILGVVITAATGLFTSTATVARENEKRLVALEVGQQEREAALIEQLQQIAADLGTMDSTTRSHDRAIARIETLIEVMRAGD